MIHVGIDLHTRNMTLTALDGNGEIVKTAKIPNKEDMLADFFSDLSAVRAVVECTSNWYWISDWCEQQGIELQLAHAKMLKAISYAKVKTDAVDARTLAELLRVDLIPQAHKCKGKQRDVRELTRARLRMIERRRRVQSSLWQIATKHNLIIQDVGWRYLEKLKSFLMNKLPNIAFSEAQLLLAQIRQLQDHIMALEKKIDEQTEFHEDVKRLQKLPGFGLVTAWSILSEIGDIRRFEDSRRFVSYCRLVPGSKDSGGKYRHKSANKDGNRYLRVAFNQAAIVAYTHYPVVRKFYKKIKKRSGRHVARTVVGKELAKIVWHMLTKGEPYKGFKGEMTKISEENYWPQPISSHK